MKNGIQYKIDRHFLTQLSTFKEFVPCKSPVCRGVLFIQGDKLRVNDISIAMTTQASLVLVNKNWTQTSKNYSWNLARHIDPSKCDTQNADSNLQTSPTMVCAAYSRFGENRSRYCFGVRYPSVYAGRSSLKKRM